MNRCQDCGKVVEKVYKIFVGEDFEIPLLPSGGMIYKWVCKDCKS